MVGFNRTITHPKSGVVLAEAGSAERFKGFANVSEVAGNSRIKMGVDCKTTSGKSTAWPKTR
jgi:hypothetical protein